MGTFPPCWLSRRLYTKKSLVWAIALGVLVVFWQFFLNVDLVHRIRGLRSLEVLQKNTSSKDLTSVTRLITAQAVNQRCIQPKLEPFNPIMAQFFHNVTPVKCSSEENWVYLSNGKFYISHLAVERHGEITCNYIPIMFHPDNEGRLHSQPINPMRNGSNITSDAFEVSCTSKSGKNYNNVHVSIVYNDTLHQRADKSALPPSALGLDVFMLGFDSVSKMTWLRKLPKTRDFFVHRLGGVELDGYNIVGDGTPQALLPILTGQTEEELPEARRGKPGADFVDNHPWIWRDFQKLGYVTVWGEDMASIGTFQYRMLGFRRQPTDHYMRPFQEEAEKLYAKNKRFCLGSVPRHKNFFDYFRAAYVMYRNKPKFLFAFHSELSHDDNNYLSVLDEDLLQFLQYLEANAYLNKTMLIMMSDHGARFSNIRKTSQGKIEERMPYFSFRFPQWFHQQNSAIMKNLQINAQRLTTPFDVHATFRDVLNFSGARLGDINKRGISLFSEIPKERSCSHAGVMPHWCACLDWENVNSSSPVVQSAIQAAVNTMNEWTAPVRDKCALLTLSNVTKSVKYSTNSEVLKFKKSADTDGRIADLSDRTQREEDFYQVTIATEPNKGMYEMTIRHSLITDTFHLSNKEISRINRYGNQSSCISGSLPALRSYCYCQGGL